MIMGQVRCNTIDVLVWRRWSCLYSDCYIGKNVLQTFFGCILLYTFNILEYKISRWNGIVFLHFETNRGHSCSRRVIPKFRIIKHILICVCIITMIPTYKKELKNWSFRYDVDYLSDELLHYIGANNFYSLRTYSIFFFFLIDL